MDIVDVKRKLRRCKSLELKIRYGNAAPKRPVLIWDAFFDLQDTGTGKAKYQLKDLAKMSHDEYKEVLDEYWSFVYQALFNENEVHHRISYDTGILLQWGLPFDADEETVKRRFRELAKQSHPDTGGTESGFIALMEAYKKLTGKQ